MNATALPSPDAVASAVFAVALLEAERNHISVAVLNDIWDQFVFERDPGARDQVFLEECAASFDAADHQSAPIGWSIGLAHQLAEGREVRRSRGAFYTPLPLSRGLVAQALGRIDSLGGDLRVCDPTCGGGAFLVTAGEALLERGMAPSDVGRALIGYDLDPVAVMATQMALALWLASVGGEPSAPTVEVHDMLHGESPRAATIGFDVVVGNPPFLGQLRNHSSRTAGQRQSLGKPMGYADAAFVALERSLDWASDGGRIVLIQPQSLLAARDARTVRERIDAEAELVGLWIGEPGLFDASVQLCAPIIDAGRSKTGPVVSFRGEDVQPGGSLAFSSWPELLADAQGVPPLDTWVAKPDRAILADIATVTADFRQWFYDLASHVVEATEIEDGLCVMTSGLIDPMVSMWGLRTARIGGKRWDAPSVSEGVVRGRLGAGHRLIPKILVANQTRCIESVVDESGRCLAITPVITVAPPDPENLWRVAALLSCPLATVIVHRQGAGSGMSTGAIRMTASRIGDLALPTASTDAWDEAADVLAEATSIDRDDGSAMRNAVLSSGLTMQRAFGVSDGGAMFDWWTHMLPTPRAPH